MFKTRLLSGIVLVAAVAVIILTGGYVMLAALACVSLIGMEELYRAMQVPSALRKYGWIGMILYLVCASTDFSRYGMMGLILAFLILLFAYVFSYPRFQAGEVMHTFFGILYVPVMLSFLLLSRSLPGGRALATLIFLCSWGCDTCAYCVGMLIGKHKMAPVLSPKKSIEGAVGGVAGAALLGALFAVLFGGRPLEYALICAAGGLISMVGDLAASAIKRNQGIKDYGNLIPGHGGILDRFDSVIITAPIIYYMSRFLLRL